MSEIEVGIPILVDDEEHFPGLEGEMINTFYSSI